MVNLRVKHNPFPHSLPRTRQLEEGGRTPVNFRGDVDVAGRAVDKVVVKGLQQLAILF